MGLTLTVPSVALEKRKDLCVHSAGFSKAGQWPQLFEQYEVPIGDVVQDRDADLERHAALVPHVDQGGPAP